jgi:hypothetical protein
MEKTLVLTEEQARQIYKYPDRIKQLLLTNFSREELEKGELVKSWCDLKLINDFYVGSDSKIIPTHSLPTITHHSNVFATERQARSVLAQAQLSQLMKAYNGDWEPIWDGENDIYVIHRFDDKILLGCNSDTYCFLSFKTAELRDEFYDNFQGLLHDYFEL